MARTYRLTRSRTPSAADEVQLTRTRHGETLAIEEVTPEDSAPVLKPYVKRVPVVRPFFHVTPTSSLADFATQSPRHPVLHLTSP